MAKKNSVATATATTATITQLKYSVPLVTGRTRAQSWTRFGIVKTGIRLAKNVTAYGKQKWLKFQSSFSTTKRERHLPLTKMFLEESLITINV